MKDLKGVLSSIEELVGSLRDENLKEERHLITREIGIDMGHRVTHHGSKCRSLHGHRYKIVATCEGALYPAGEQQGMVLDFAFLKEEMMLTIDKLCDHGTVLWEEDELVDIIYPEVQGLCFNTQYLFKDIKQVDEPYFLLNQCKVVSQGVCKAGKLVVVPFVPTAENLARWWYQLLKPRVEERSNNQATLVELKVWETPNCAAIYPSINLK